MNYSGNKGRMFRSPRNDREKWETGEGGAIKKFYRGELVLNPKRWEVGLGKQTGEGKSSLNTPISCS